MSIALVSKAATCAILWILLLLAAIAHGEARSDPASPIHQLRIYEIFDDTRVAFHDRFRDHAARIMAKYGFKIVAMWESRDEDRLEFVYILEWPDEQTMKVQWAKFMADEEWKDIKRKSAAKHGQFVGDIEDRTLKPTDYSPRRTLLE